MHMQSLRRLGQLIYDMIYVIGRRSTCFLGKPTICDAGRHMPRTCVSPIQRRLLPRMPRDSCLVNPTTSSENRIAPHAKTRTQAVPRSSLEFQSATGRLLSAPRRTNRNNPRKFALVMSRLHLRRIASLKRRGNRARSQRAAFIVSGA